MNKIKTAAKAWWDSLNESTRRAIKTSWQAFFGTAAITFGTGAAGVTNMDTLTTLAVSALAAGLAAAAAKFSNLKKDAEAAE